MEKLNNLLGKQIKQQKSMSWKSMEKHRIDKRRRITQGFNEFFSNIGHELASKIYTNNTQVRKST